LHDHDPSSCERDPSPTGRALALVVFLLEDPNAVVRSFELPGDLERPVTPERSPSVGA
jgi:hypothetical protein